MISYVKHRVYVSNNPMNGKNSLEICYRDILLIRSAKEYIKFWIFSNNFGYCVCGSDISILLDSRFFIRECIEKLAGAQAIFRRFCTDKITQKTNGISSRRIVLETSDFY